MQSSAHAAAQPILSGTPPALLHMQSSAHAAAQLLHLLTPFDMQNHLYQTVSATQAVTRPTQCDTTPTPMHSTGQSTNYFEQHLAKSLEPIMQQLALIQQNMLFKEKELAELKSMITSRTPPVAFANQPLASTHQPMVYEQSLPMNQHSVTTSQPSICPSQPSICPSQPSISMLPQRENTQRDVSPQVVKHRKVIDLPDFKGTPEDWPMFLATYKETTAVYQY